MSKDASESSSRLPRTIVLCFDGTNGQYSTKNTNIVKLFGLLRKDCPDRQAVYYQPGIGTYFAPGVVSPLWQYVASTLDQGVAWYLDAHVMSGYRFLMDNYCSGDKICIFGFSRGAYTARALAGMLDKVGLLSKGNTQQVNFAYKAYARADKEGVKLAAGFKQTFSQDVKIDFLGVWDTVQSTGVLFSRSLPFSISNTSIRVFRHALALDERRARFRPNLYQWSTPEPEDVDDLENGASKNPSLFQRLFKRNKQKDEPVQVVSGATNGRNGHPKSKFVAENVTTTTDVLEVWFSGCHSDVGGGNEDDGVDVSLAQISLHWMVEQALEAQCGIVFDTDALARIGFTPSTQFSGSKGLTNSDVDTATSSNETNQFPQRPDAVAKLYDWLSLEKSWWLLEILPISNTWQDEFGAWHTQWYINFGRGRFIPFEKPKFHHTVKQRMDKLKYSPRALYDDGTEVYV